MAKIVKMQDGENPDMVLVPQTNKFSIILNSKNGVTSQIDLSSTSVSILKTMLKEWESKQFNTSDSNCIIPNVSESVVKQMINHCKISYVDDSKGLPAMLMGDVAEIIKIASKKNISWEELVKEHSR